MIVYIYTELCWLFFNAMLDVKTFWQCLYKLYAEKHSFRINQKQRFAGANRWNIKSILLRFFLSETVCARKPLEYKKYVIIGI